MKKQHLQRLENLSDDEKKIILNKLPVIDRDDKTNIELRWILWKNGISSESNEIAIANFASSFVDTSKTKQELEYLLLEDLTWETGIRRILNNPGLAFEYFLVDHMQRDESLNQHHAAKENKIKIFHKKTAAEQDGDNKLDFLSNVFFKNEQWKIDHLNIGVQLTTTKTNANSYKTMYQLEEKRYHSNKKLTIKEQSKLIAEDEKYSEVYSPSYKPDLTAYMVVNWNINNFMNIEWINVFKEAFMVWQWTWFWEEGPADKLNELIKSDLKIIAKNYHFAIRDFVADLMKMRSHQDIENFREFSHKKTKIIKKISEDKSEVLYDFFKITGNWEQFLFKVSFFPNDILLAGR